MHLPKSISATAVALSLALPAIAADGVIWFGTRTEDGASLIYGTPNSGYGKIAFTCAAGQDELTFVYEHEPIDAQAGIETDVLLSAGDIEVAIPTTGIRLDIDETFILEGRTKLDNRLRDLLASVGTLTVTVDDGSEEYPLDGASKAAKHLLEACSPDA